MKVSIGRQIQEALDKLLLEDPGQALIQALLAVAATSKRRYRKEKDGEAFRAFVRDSMSVITTAGISATCDGLIMGSPGRTIEAILYDIRCQVVHELKLPSNIQFTENRIGGAETILLPKSIVYGLIAAVVVAPENSEEDIPLRYGFNVRGEVLCMNDYWGRKDALLQAFQSARNPKA